MPHGAYREDKGRKGAVYLKVVYKSNSFSFIGLYNNFFSEEKKF